uniref:DinB family protein n=1 Tax=Solibacter usitatus (strain Ellin6076) TaxID=234267 RepID=Q020J6_SOLUE
MDLTVHFQLLARYNRIANERLYSTCACLNDAEYRKQRPGSFGSIHGLLNHILLGDRRWMGLFEEGQRATPPLGQILYDDFASLRSARVREDARIEAFFSDLDVGFWGRSFPYTNNQGKDYIESAHVACSHLFNHQTHHRGQVHIMLSQAEVAPPALDLHRIINP